MVPHILISSEAISLLTHHGVPQKEFVPTSHAGIVFPDGSVLIRGNDPDLTERLQKAFVVERLVACTVFRSLSAFGGHIYALWYPWSYQQVLGELSLNVVPRVATPVTQLEQRLTDLPVGVSFLGRLTVADRDAFLVSIIRWREGLSDVADRGSSAGLSQEKVSFARRAAVFHLHLSATDETPLLWLILVLLRFGCTTSPIDAIVLAQENSLDKFGVHLSRSPVVLDLPR